MREERLRGNLTGLVLAALADGPAHGYAVIGRLRERSAGDFDLAEGTVYPVLHRLLADALVTARMVEVDGRRRRVYTLTAGGRRELGRAASPVAAVQPRGLPGDRRPGMTAMPA